MSQTGDVDVRVGESSESSLGARVGESVQPGGAGTSGDLAAESARRRLGAWYTPPELVEHLLDRVLEPVLATRRVPDGLRIIDPACGDGAFLLGAAERLARAFPHVPAWRRGSCLYGVDLDPAALERCRVALGPGPILRLGDALAEDLGEGSFDVVIGNPPFLAQLQRRSATDRPTAAARLERFGKVAKGYVDTAVLFLALAHRLARPRGGRIGLVLPQSVLASRDAGAARAEVLTDAALDGLWVAGERVFDADVLTVAVSLVRGIPQGEVERWTGRAFASLTPRPAPDLATRPTWSHLIADGFGVPPLTLALTGGLALGALATASAGFRDEYYGIVPHVRDLAETEETARPGGPPELPQVELQGLDPSCMPVVTCGLIDVGRLLWGERATRIAGRRVVKPVVDVENLAAPHQAWARRQAVPKLLVATQTPVIEAVADPTGRLLPLVPVITVVPHRVEDLWRVLAVVLSPVASVWAASTYLGAALTTSSIKLSARQVMAIPTPATAHRRWEEAASLLRDGRDLYAAGAAMVEAYEVGANEREAVLGFWADRYRRRNASRRGKTIAALSGQNVSAPSSKV